MEKSELFIRMHICIHAFCMHYKTPFHLHRSPRNHAITSIEEVNQICCHSSLQKAILKKTQPCLIGNEMDLNFTPEIWNLLPVCFFFFFSNIVYVVLALYLFFCPYNFLKKQWGYCKRLHLSVLPVPSVIL